MSLLPLSVGLSDLCWTMSVLLPFSVGERDLCNSIENWRWAFLTWSFARQVPPSLQDLYLAVICRPVSPCRWWLLCGKVQTQNLSEDCLWIEALVGRPCALTWQGDRSHDFPSTPLTCDFMQSLVNVNVSYAFANSEFGQFSIVSTHIQLSVSLSFQSLYLGRWFFLSIAWWLPHIQLEIMYYYFWCTN